MSKNKLKKFAEIEQMQHVFQCSYNDLAPTNSFELKGCWHEKFFGNNNPITLELGCGKGEYTVELAKRNPNRNFIGIDIKGARLWTGATQAKAENLRNVAFLRTGIHLLCAFFAENEVDEIWITFPDPQMKKVRKRLTSSTFLNVYRTFLNENGVVHLKTDSNFLFNYTAELVKTSQLPLLNLCDNIYENELPNPELEIKTYYERQWLARGITIKYIAFRLPKNCTFVEPAIEIPLDEYRSFGRNQRSELKI